MKTQKNFHDFLGSMAADEWPASEWFEGETPKATWSVYGVVSGAVVWWCGKAAITRSEKHPQQKAFLPPQLLSNRVMSCINTRIVVGKA